MRFAPRSAKAIAKASPIPEDAPVTQIRLFLKKLDIIVRKLGEDKLPLQAKVEMLFAF